MRIGIVTFYSECNYGAFLQALGSKKVLESMGHDVTFINFNPAKDSSFLLKLGLHDGTFSRKVARRYKIYFKYKLKPYCKPYLDAFARARHDFFAETEKVGMSSVGISDDSGPSVAAKHPRFTVGEVVVALDVVGKAEIFCFSTDDGNGENLTPYCSEQLSCALDLARKTDYEEPVGSTETSCLVEVLSPHRRRVNRVRHLGNRRSVENVRDWSVGRFAQRVDETVRASGKASCQSADSAATRRGVTDSLVGGERKKCVAVGYGIEVDAVGGDESGRADTAAQSAADALVGVDGDGKFRTAAHRFERFVGARRHAHAALHTLLRVKFRAFSAAVVCRVYS